MTVQELAGHVLASGKYAGVDQCTVNSLCAQALSRYKKAQEAEKAVKRQLHIIHQSFLVQKGISRAGELLAAWPGGRGDRAFSMAVMEQHLSTRERLPHLDPFYTFINQATGPADSILDIGCGLHPFALPWMEGAEGARYSAWDISSPIADLLNLYFSRLGMSCSQAQVRNAILHPPGEPVDLAYLLKLLPVLEQQKKGAATELLTSLKARHIVASFPIKSLSGRERGMEEHYSAFLEAILPDTYHIAARRIIGRELVYILRSKQL